MAVPVFVSEASMRCEGAGFTPAHQVVHTAGQPPVPGRDPLPRRDVSRPGPRFVARPAAGVTIALLLAACTRLTPGGDAMSPGAPESTFALPVEWLADSARGVLLPVEPPPAVWLTRVTPSAAPTPVPPLPEPLPAVPERPPGPPALEIEPGLTPPIPRRVGRIVAPAGLRTPAYVELEVEVDESGGVREARWAGGSLDPALVEAAVDCAYTMEFFPAMRGDAPVAVWCRHRFDFLP
jgi:hypothetical protein